jgi:hypothetical protein
VGPPSSGGRTGAAAGRSQQPGEPRAFVPEDERVERLGQRTDAVEIRPWQACSRAVFPPLGPGKRLTLRTVAMTARVVGIAFAPPVRPLCSMPAEWGGTADSKGVEALLRGGRHRLGGTIRLAIAAEDVRDCPRRGAGLSLPWRWVAAGGPRGHALTPLGGAGGDQHARDHRGGLRMLARCVRLTRRERGVVTSDRWPSSSWMGRGSPPAASRWVAKEWRRGWRPLPGWRVAARLAWESIRWAVPMGLGRERSCPGHPPRGGRSSFQ